MNSKEEILIVSVSRRDFLDYLSTVDFVKLKTIHDDWSQILQECVAVAEAHPDYAWPLVYDDGKFEAWGKNGQQLGDSLDQNKKWGYLPTNTISWKTTCKQPQLHMSWEQRIAQALPFEPGCVVTPTLMKPGNVMPWHTDGFYYFKDRCDQDLQQYVARSLIFVKDWETGHYLQAGDSVIHHWRAGEVLIWHPERHHVVANVGYTDRWTCNVTGVLQATIDFTLPA
jgi:hypothetical protein